MAMVVVVERPFVLPSAACRCERDGESPSLWAGMVSKPLPGYGLGLDLKASQSKYSYTCVSVVINALRAQHLSVFEG